MIEIICNSSKDRQTDKRYIQAKEPPKNIKQIGDVCCGRKIYIEDYAFTYINSISYQQDSEIAGVLMGEISQLEGQMCIFIKGVIKAKNPGSDEICFNEVVWSQVYSETEKYFPELDVVGWFAALPRINSEAISRMKKIHMDNFAGKEKTMYLIDIEEKEENFYLYEDGEIRKQRGYVCFYERNYEMQEYMLDNNRNRRIEKPDTEKVVHSMRAIMREKEERMRHRRVAALSYAACAFMASVVVVTGINLVKSYEKMKRIDSSIDSIVREVSNLNAKEMTTAVQDDIVPVNVVYETTTESTTAVTSQPTTQEQSQSQTLTQPATEPVYKRYVVQQGDTIYGISKKNYGTIDKAEQIIALNNLTDANKLYVGQEIKLP